MLIRLFQSKQYYSDHLISVKKIFTKGIILKIMNGNEKMSNQAFENLFNFKIALYKYDETI